MTAIPQQQQQQQQQGLGGQQQSGTGPGLPPTGLQQQLNSLRSSYQSAKTARIKGFGSVGYDVQSQAKQQNKALPGQALQATGERPPGMPAGSTSLNDLARRLASSYGLAIGRNDLVDAEGNFNMTPDQIAGASGGAETLGTAAAKMNYIASAIQKRQQSQALQKSEAALQSGLGLASQRRPGSMIEQQQQFYAGLASLYQQQDYQAADFSYFIQKEKMDIEQAMIRNAQKLAKKKAQAGFWGGLAMTGVNIAMGNYGGAVQSGIGAYGSGAEAGYF